MQLSYRVNWYEILMYNDMNQATDWIVEKIKLLIKDASSSTSKKRKPKKPWVTSEIVMLIDQK